ncbi:helicase-associated domain-containing protein [Curtobacterium sp. MCPF17_050]|uniref:helicase-associated domain-containing protein n=1 Tax=Curtobacterium sp. MCPF17_050 TaxID=2175664 RepID=UPI000D81D2CB|nr:helicase-associated domain-containing protein [Curtobacterium sp. MCPF17_050]WIB15146.1 helicase-associated domain-containing protein [Curtobacterium sp. MCPF17_050]
MTTTTDLAARLRELPDDALEQLVLARALPTAALGESGPQHIADFFDLAEALRTDDAVDAAVERLPRRTLVALRDGGPAEDLAPAVALGLVGRDGAVDDAVTSRLAARPDLVPDGPGGPAPVRPAAAAQQGADGGTDDARARATGAEHAFETLTVLAELLRAADDGAVRELAKGGIGAPLARQLAERTGADAAVVADRLALLDRIGAAHPVDGSWTVSDRGRTWLHATWPERWASLVHDWRDALAPAVVEVLTLADDDLTDLVALGRWAYPAGSRWLDAALLDAAGAAGVLGLAVAGRLTSTGHALLGDDRDAALAAAVADLPGTVDGVYLQPDLTVIAPGPLSPADDDDLRAVADLEAPGLAARYRVSEDSLRRALRAGRTREEVVALFTRLGATDVPQPLTYLIDQVATRDGSVVVGRGEGDLGSVVHGTPEQLDLVGVDAELRQLAWERPDLTTLVTKYPPHVVASALEDQRYPAVLAADARPETRSGPPVRRRTPSRSPEQAARALVERLRLTTERGDAEPEQEWMARQIDMAVRGRTPIRVTVRMPDGSEKPFSIVPTSVAAGRVRGRDTAVDVERTLPLSLVVTIESDA